MSLVTKQRARQLLWLLGGAFMLFCAAVLVLAATGLHDDLGKADVALVLGSKVEHDGSPSPRLRARLDRTIELYQAGYFSKVIASGGVGKEGFDEAAVMRDYLAGHGIPKEKIIVDSHGDTTFASARFTKEIVTSQQLQSVLVISQYFHVPRARLALHKFGVATVYSAHARIFEPRDAYSCARELVACVRYYFRAYPPAAPNP